MCITEYTKLKDASKKHDERKNNKLQMTNNK